MCNGDWDLAGTKTYPTLEGHDEHTVNDAYTQCDATFEGSVGQKE